MSRAIRLFVLSIIGCLAQTSLAQGIRIAGVAPDLMIAMLIALTAFTGYNGAFCTSALMIMFYDVSVGYVMALNTVSYVLVALAATWLNDRIYHAKPYEVFRKAVMNSRFKIIFGGISCFIPKLFICFLLTLCRELITVVYLFLIGASMGMVTIGRMFLCAGYTALMVFPAYAVIRFVINWHPLKFAQKKRVNVDDDDSDMKP